MARLPRITPAGIPQHLIQRGNNRQACFCCEDDFIAYAGWLKEYSRQYDVRIYAWVFMTNHVHLLATPQADNGISKMMQSLGRMYVRYFNRAYKRSGTLWEGRYKSCLIQSESYLLHCYRYIELNPVHAQMVQRQEDYYWSSHAAYALGKPSSLLFPHLEYLKLGRYPKQRCERYRSLFQHTWIRQLCGKSQSQPIRDLRSAQIDLKKKSRRCIVVGYHPEGWSTEVVRR